MLFFSNRKPEYETIEGETGEVETAANVSFVSSRSMNNITNRLDANSSQRLNRSLPVKPTTRIKIVKKQKSAAQSQVQGQQQPSQHRSVSPGVLRRAPDIIETIETKTSMSFIMNKSVNMLVEEKREPPPLPPRHSSVRTTSSPGGVGGSLSNAISQPQLYQSRIDDLLTTANSLIKSSNNADVESTGNKTIYRSKFRLNNGAFKQVEPSSAVTTIPITVQSRSKSEPKLDIEFENSLADTSRISYRVCQLLFFLSLNLPLCLYIYIYILGLMST